MDNVNEKRMQAMEFTTQADALLEAGNVEGAMEYYRKAIAADSSYTEPVLNLGHVFVGQDRYAEAKEQYNRAIALDKKCAAAYFHLGNVCLLEGDYPGALHQYTLATGAEGTEAQLYFNQGLAHEGMGNTDMALRSYARAVRRNPDQPAFRIKLAQLQIESMRYDGAKETLEESIRLFPDIFEGYHFMYVMMMRNGKADEAEAFLKKATERFSEDASLTGDLVDLYVFKHDYAAALDLIEKALKMPGDSTARRNLLYAKAKVMMSTDRHEEGFEILAVLHSEANGEIDNDVRFFALNMEMADKRYSKLLENAHEIVTKGQECQAYYAALYFEGYATEMLEGAQAAQKLYNRAVRKLRTITLRNGRALDAYVYRAMCLRGLGEYSRALELLDYVMRIGGEAQLELHALKGLIYHDMNDAQSEAKELELLENGTRELSKKYSIAIKE